MTMNASHIIKNDGYNLAVISNDLKVKLVFKRATLKAGAVYGDDGKCTSHTFTFAGYDAFIYGIRKGQENVTDSHGHHYYDEPLKFVMKGGVKRGSIKYKNSNKKDIIEKLKVFMGGLFTEAYNELTTR